MKSWILLLLIIFPLNQAFAEIETGNLIVKVYSEESQILPAAFVTISNMNVAFSKETHTERQGWTVFRNIPSGFYSIKVQMDGFNDDIKVGIPVRKMTTIIRTFLTFGVMRECPCVYGTGPLIDTRFKEPIYINLFTLIYSISYIYLQSYPWPVQPIPKYYFTKHEIIGNSIMVTVFKEDGTTTSDAKVIVTSKSTTLKWNNPSFSSGKLNFSDLPEGLFSVNAFLDGYQPSHIDDVKLIKPSIVTIEFYLEKIK